MQSQQNQLNANCLFPFKCKGMLRQAPQDCLSLHRQSSTPVSCHIHSLCNLVPPHLPAVWGAPQPSSLPPDMQLPVLDIHATHVQCRKSNFLHCHECNAGPWALQSCTAQTCQQPTLSTVLLHPQEQGQEVEARGRRGA